MAQPAPLVLIVDDSQDLRVIHGAFLEFWGYRIAEAKCGEEAVEKAKRLRPSVILLDMKMPGMDGFEVTRLLREDERTRSLPIIAVSAYGLPAFEAAALKAGCDTFLQKPVHPQELQLAVKRVLER